MQGINPKYYVFCCLCQFFFLSVTDVRAHISLFYHFILLSFRYTIHALPVYVLKGSYDMWEVWKLHCASVESGCTGRFY